MISAVAAARSGYLIVIAGAIGPYARDAAFLLAPT
jgi:hypothetical protein